jgi:hypothetical protein
VRRVVATGPDTLSALVFIVCRLGALSRMITLSGVARARPLHRRQEGFPVTHTLLFMGLSLVLANADLAA